MTVQTDLAGILQTGGLDVDQTLLGVALFDGRTWVLLDTYSIDGPGIGLTVVVAVTPGHDLHALIAEAWALIEASDGFQPTDFAAAYGSVPLARRGAVPADWAAISVATNYRL